MGAVVQMEIFPGVTSVDKLETRSLLKEYPTMQRKISVYSSKTSLTFLEAEELAKYQRRVREIDTAMELILDDEVRRIIRHRYISARKHKYTLATFGDSTSAATINRRIDIGVETIAEHLKLAEII
ncbi:hypothetical protein A8L34_22430 [Bacillus sp. FJAT-27264]|uniref:hypothetical protein n=1 Tax=Paenibacillus sp. (strain DSM 101736 / FJAT-27264) TaxID=1850362 RepID=UPI000807FC45|nr:hypothetical protein [Bacillus sp. FJAT-27264]OBZ08913.1 hypothetical protein A8L34_22430 [Bacillus sp. FJAT-27264]